MALNPAALTAQSSWDTFELADISYGDTFLGGPLTAIFEPNSSQMALPAPVFDLFRDEVEVAGFDCLKSQCTYTGDCKELITHLKPLHFKLGEGTISIQPEDYVYNTQFDEFSCALRIERTAEELVSMGGSFLSDTAFTTDASHPSFIEADNSYAFDILDLVGIEPPEPHPPEPDPDPEPHPKPPPDPNPAYNIIGAIILIALAIGCLIAVCKCIIKCCES